MRHLDQYGLPLTTDSPAAAEAYVEALDLLLRNQIGAQERLMDALDHDPCFALARAALAFQQQFQSDPRLPVGQILLAAHHGKRASARERHLIEAVRHALVGGPAAADMMRNHLEAFPRDVLIIRAYVIQHSYSGDEQRKTSTTSELGRLASHFGTDPWFLGLHSLFLSEVGDVSTAIRLAETGLAARLDHGVLAHSLAHTYFEKGEDAAGREFLRGWLTDFGDSFINAGHLTWHLALTDLALAEPERALGLYRLQAAAKPPCGFRLEDAISLLWRLQLRGFDVGAEWEAVLQREPSAGASRAFELAHVAFALAGVGDEDGLRRLADQVTEEAARRPHRPFHLLAPLITALCLVSKGKWADAAPALELAGVAARHLGGSNEQHTVFDETLAVAYRRAGRAADADRLEHDRLRGRRMETLAG